MTSINQILAIQLILPKINFKIINSIEKLLLKEVIILEIEDH